MIILFENMHCYYPIIKYSVGDHFDKPRILYITMNSFLQLLSDREIYVMRQSYYSFLRLFTCLIFLNIVYKLNNIKIVIQIKILYEENNNK